MRLFFFFWFWLFLGLSIGLVEIGDLGDFEKNSNRFIRWLAKSINQYDGLGKTSAIVVIKMKREREKKASRGTRKACGGTSASAII